MPRLRSERTRSQERHQAGPTPSNLQALATQESAFLSPHAMESCFTLSSIRLTRSCWPRTSNGRAPLRLIFPNRAGLIEVRRWGARKRRAGRTRRILCSPANVCVCVWYRIRVCDDKYEHLYDEGKRLRGGRRNHSVGYSEAKIQNKESRLTAQFSPRS